MLYSYKAVDEFGIVVTDAIEANSKKEVYDVLRTKHLTPITIEGKVKEEKKRKDKAKATVVNQNDPVEKIKNFFFNKPKIKNKELVFLFYNLSTMIDSGVSIDKSIEISISQMKSKFAADVLRSLLEDVKRGMNLSDAIRKSQAFPRLVAPIIKAGEESGNLERSFEYLSAYYERQAKVGGKVIGALIYPVIVFLGVIVALYVVSTKVLPSILNVVNQGGGQIGIETKIIMGISKFFQEYGLLPVLGIILIPAIFILIMRKLNRRKLDRFIVRVPLIGSFIKQSASIQFTTTLYILISSGVTINRALDICIEVIKNGYIREQLEMVKRGVMKGEPLSENLNEEIFGKVACNIIKVGEESGQLAEPLNKTTNYLNEKLDETTKRLTDLIGPATILIIAVMVGFIVLGTLKPLMSIYQNTGA